MLFFRPILKGSYYRKMSVESIVGIVKLNGDVEAINVSFDGYPNGIGPYLLEKLNTTEIVDRIIKEGSCDSLTSRKVRYTEKPRMKFNDTKHLQNYVEKENKVSYIYLWIEHDSLWKFIDTKKIDEFIHLKKYLNQ